MKTVLLTGATGYIGQYAVRPLLKKGYAVHAVSSRPTTHEVNKNVHWHQADLLDNYAVDLLLDEVHPSHLLHFAWFVEHGAFWYAPENVDWVRSSLYLGQAFVKSGGQRAVFAGSCAEYDWTRKGPYTESVYTDSPQTLYGATKSALSLIMEKFAEISDLSFASGKIFFPFGAGEPVNRLIPSVIRSLLNNEPAKTTHGKQVRDFMFVEDLADVFVELLGSDVCGSVNLASGIGVELRMVVEKIAEILGRTELLRIGALAAKSNEPAEIVADISRLRNEVGFRREVDLRLRLVETVDWWKEKYEIND